VDSFSYTFNCFNSVKIIPATKHFCSTTVPNLRDQNVQWWAFEKEIWVHLSCKMWPRWTASS